MTQIEFMKTLYDNCVRKNQSDFIYDFLLSATLQGDSHGAKPKAYIKELIDGYSETNKKNLFRALNNEIKNYINNDFDEAGVISFLGKKVSQTKYGVLVAALGMPEETPTSDAYVAIARQFKEFLASPDNDVKNIMPTILSILAVQNRGAAGNELNSFASRYKDANSKFLWETGAEGEMEKRKHFLYLDTGFLESFENEVPPKQREVMFDDFLKSINITRKSFCLGIDATLVGEYVALKTRFDYISLSRYEDLTTPEMQSFYKKYNDKLFTDTEIKEVGEQIRYIKTLFPNDCFLTAKGGIILLMDEEYMRVAKKKIGFKFKSGNISMVGMLEKHASIVREESAPANQRLDKIQIFTFSILRKLGMIREEDSDIFLITPIAIYY